MKVAIATELFYPQLYGGGEHRLWEVLKRISKHIDIVVLTSGYPRLPREEIVEGIRVRRISKPVITDSTRSTIATMEYFTKLPTGLMSERPDVIDINTYTPVLPAYTAAKLLNKPVIATVHNVYERSWLESLPSRLHGALGLLTELYTLKLPYTAIAVPSSILKQKLKERGIPPSRIHVIPNGIDLKLIDSVKAEKKEGQIAYVGRLIPTKGLHILIKAIALLRDPSITLAVAGEGPAKKPCQELAEKLKVNVRWLGHIKDRRKLIKLIRESEILVHPSTQEGHPVAILEAMACRTPVIAAESTGAIELLREAGYITKPSPRAIAQAILELHESPEKRRKLAEKARKRAENYTWEKAAEKQLKLYIAVSQRSHMVGDQAARDQLKYLKS